MESAEMRCKRGSRRDDGQDSRTKEGPWKNAYCKEHTSGEVQQFVRKSTWTRPCTFQFKLVALSHFKWVHKWPYTHSDLPCVFCSARFHLEVTLGFYASCNEATRRFAASLKLNRIGKHECRDFQIRLTSVRNSV